MPVKQGAKVLSELIKMGTVKNDGKQNMYVYEPTTGVWEYKKAIQIRRYIAYFAKDIGIHLTSDEVRRIEKELLEHIDLFCEQLSWPDDPEWICARNGMVNLKTLEIKEHNPLKYCTKGLNFNFNKDSKIIYSQAFRRFLQTSLGVKDIVDSEKKYVPKVKLSLQILLYCLSNLQGAKKAAVFLGEPHTGKSVLIKFIAQMVGENGYAALSLADLGDRFRCSLLENIHLILSHEMANKGLRNLDILKSIISAEPIIIEAKGKQPKNFTPQVKILMGANSLPTLDEIDAGNAFADRLTVLKFGKSVKTRNLHLLEDLYKDRDAIMSVVVKEGPEFIQRNLTFVEDEDGVNALKAYKSESNSVADFLNEQYEMVDDGKAYLREMYELYEDFSNSNCLHACNQRSFRQQILQLGYQIKKTRLRQNENPRACVCNIKKKNGECNV